ncbi:tetratricopeptide repeat protein [Spirulina subsalsa FACHB-351]|uniref:Tetratricopeptide repeat protein n=1 Tax=Spirulina subsalsa FACHB-351 TaxID=234711 RepID=A0ABT3L0D2_9CYAN|nr:Sll0314/Alr1548 family TPR repeat-containing protein [Spirulina subsalsa]MCW6034953.1 tetratricopeptide repeat protein [Spirulina subsalsa FACHB-351]
MNVSLTAIQRLSLTFSSAIALSLTLWGNPALAGDPFRTNNPRNISDTTEAAFEAYFKYGNYPEAARQIEAAIAEGTNDPLALSLRAALAFQRDDLAAFKSYADQTLAAAQSLMSQDPLRGNLYTAIGHFLEGTHTFKTRGPIGAVSKLQEVLRYLQAAERVDPNDPELNIIKGYMDLLLAVNVPFVSADKAIANLQRNAAPSYLVNRGIALAYRDLGEYDKAQTYIEKALSETPNNPEVIYLQAQILHEKGKQNNQVTVVQQSVQLFDSAIAQKDQLPAALIPQMERERRIAQEWLNENS